MEANKVNPCNLGESKYSCNQIHVLSTHDRGSCNPFGTISSKFLLVCGFKHPDMKYISIHLTLSLCLLSVFQSMLTRSVELCNKPSHKRKGFAL